MNTTFSSSHIGRRVAAILAFAAVGLTAAVPTAQAGTANQGLAKAGSNPIANMTWGTPHDDDLWSGYQSVSGSNRTLLGRIALKPRAFWLGAWDKTSQMKATTAAVVSASQNGNPNALTEFATFELNPWEGQAATGSWNVSDDEAWYRNMAAGIGSARALVIVQIDLPFALKTKSTAPEQINAYATRTLGANPHTTVYLDGGTAGWLTPAQDASLLIANGIRNARGFALDDTDYDPTGTEDLFGAQVLAALAKRGVRGKHFIVDTDENGQPFGTKQVQAGEINDQPMCHGAIQTVCQRTGIPPTTNVASKQWKLSAAAARAAKRYCDGYVWSGRPWDINGGPFDLQNALWLAANGKY